MKLPKLKHTLVVSLALCTLVVGTSTAFAKKTKRAYWDWKRDTDVSLKYGFVYDSNFIELSDADLDRYETNTLPLVSDLQTYDDGIHKLGASFGIDSPKWIGWRKGRLNYSVSQSLNTRNDFANRAVHIASFSHDAIKRVDILGYYMYIPERYLRDYYDKDFGEVYACDFNYQIGNIGLSYSPASVKGLRLTLRYELFSVYYNETFTEYDTEGSGIRFDARYKLNKRFTLRSSIRKRWGDNTGFDSNNFAAATNDLDAEYGDATYGEEWFEFSGTYSKMKVLGKSTSFTGMIRMRHRYYTSDLSLAEDPFHAGREHNHWRFSGTFNVRLTKALTLSPSGEYEMRKTDSPLQKVKDAKDFDAFRVGLELSCRLW